MGWSRAVAVVSGALALGGAPSLGAQTGGWVDLDFARVETGRYPNTASELAFSAAPSVRQEWRRFSASYDGAFTVSGRNHYFIQNSLVALARNREYRGVVFEGGVGASGLLYRTANTIRTIGVDGENVVPIAKSLFQLDVRGRADYALGLWGFSLSGSAGENFGGSVRLPWGVEAGVTRELSHVLLFTSVRADRFRRNHPLEVYSLDAQYSVDALSANTAFVPRIDPILTLASGGTVAFGRGEITGEVGGRQGSRDVGLTGARVRSWGEWWFSAAGSYRVTPNMLVRAAVGGYPTDYIRQLPNGSYASVGIRVERGKRQQVDWYQPPNIPAFRVDTISGGARVIRLRAPRALKVDLSGDFTDWTPLPMHSLPGGGWELVLPITAGTYRVSVRVDGGPWSAPPGLVPVADEFNGEVGVVVIR